MKRLLAYLIVGALCLIPAIARAQGVPDPGSNGIYSDPTVTADPVDAPTLDTSLPTDPAQQVVVHIGNETATRALPTTLAESNRVLLGMVTLLNDVIAAYESDSANAQVKLAQILQGENAASVALKKSTEALTQVAAAPQPKNVAWGAFLDFNPTPALTGTHVAFGPEVTFNLFNSFLLTGKAGVAVDSPSTVRFDLGFAVQYWAF